MKKLLKISIILITVILMYSVAVSVFYLFGTEKISHPSPDGKYTVEANWIDIGAWGYRGKIYFTEKKLFFTKKYFTGETVPAGYGSISDTEFYIDKGEGKIKKYNVKDFKRSGHNAQ
ncbi:hypothetical protein [Acetivibrio sp. MSJd-27]|uniref:hypothetical protein n=1 Tax=Acetivibrio sp. MSJd-27 TaxID=2841523 RepID=UPI001C1243E3|nr:hypothetical protein [Acetivibrio sp. MSJd-27]MBU5449281.1 hypothetical protein [Acetivibrio sp. MSJd-27]